MLQGGKFMEQQTNLSIHFTQNESIKDIYEILLYFCFKELEKCNIG